MWEHERKGLGENLAYQWSTGPLQLSDVIITAIKSWYNEKAYWNWTKTCEAACHYTQVIVDVLMFTNFPIASSYKVVYYCSYHNFNGTLEGIANKNMCNCILFIYFYTLDMKEYNKL